MKAFKTTFTYPDSETGEPVERHLLVTNEDFLRVGGIYLNGLSDSEIESVLKKFGNNEIKPFPEKHDGSTKNVDFIGEYRIFSKNKIVTDLVDDDEEDSEEEETEEQESSEEKEEDSDEEDSEEKKEEEE